MFKHILVPLDGSTLAENVLPACSSLAARLKASVTLLHLIEQNAPAEVHHERHLTRPAEAEEYLAGLAAKNFTKGTQVDWHVHTAQVRDVARSIAEHAAELESDLIVMCTHGEGGMRDILFGSIAQQVIARGATPVLVLRPGFSSTPEAFALRTILLPLDDASVHDDIFPYAEALAKAYAARIVLLTVIHTFGTLKGEEAATSSLLPGTTSALLDIEEQSVREHLQGHVDELAAKKLTASASVARGDPAAEIVSAAQSEGVDLLLLATHRKKGMDAFWSNSVAPTVAQKTNKPLLLLPLREREPK